MKGIGAALWILGLAAFCYAILVFPTAVTSDFSPSGSIVNLDLQQRQFLIAAAGLALFVTGSIVHALGLVIDAVAASARPLAAPSAQAVEDELSKYGC